MERSKKDPYPTHIVLTMKLYWIGAMLTEERE